MTNDIVDQIETKGEKFTRLAILRVTNALDKIRLIGNLANQDIYDYSEEQVRQIERALIEKVNETMSKFSEKENQEAKFSFATRHENDVDNADNTL